LQNLIPLLEDDHLTSTWGKAIHIEDMLDMHYTKWYGTELIKNILDGEKEVLLNIISSGKTKEKRT
jgi:hypothetical protein